VGLIEYENELETALFAGVKRGVKIYTREEMPTDFYEVTRDLLIMQWLAEHIGGKEYIQCIHLGRTAKEKQEIEMMGLEEMGHGRIIKDGPLAVLGEDPYQYLYCGVSFQDSVKRQPKLLRVFKYPEILSSSYVHFRVFNGLQDASADLQLKWVKEGPFAPYTEAIERIEREEEGHVESGRRCLREICATASGRREAQNALNFWLPLVLEVFGSPDAKKSKKLSAYHHWGYKPKEVSNDQARRIYTALVRPFFREIGLRWPTPRK
jgi:1,2-phenylacetyl-CoA epoxidase catalytic subunit